MAQILVVDDEVGIRDLLSEILSDEGHTVHVAENATRAREWRANARPDLVLLDIWMPDTDGVTLLKEWASSGQLTMPVIMMSGHATIDTAVEATRIGALDFLEKPIALQKLLGAVKRALAKSDVRTAEGGVLTEAGKSPAMADLKRRLLQLAAVDSPVLLRGERGSMPEIFARLLHRSGTPWVQALPALGEGAQEILQQASGGVLFVDDLARLSPNQQKHLAFLVARAARARVRLISFSSEGPRHLTDVMGLDSALVAALSEVRITLPLVQDFREDLPVIVQKLLAQLIESRTCPPRRISADAMSLLAAFDWPGHLADIASAVRTLATTSTGDEIGIDDVQSVLPQFAPPVQLASPTGPAFDLPLREARDAFERSYFEHHLAVEAGSIARVAEKSGLERTHLYRKLKALGISTGRKESES
jgi:DNA-binding NtrC family response regulator